MATFVLLALLCGVALTASAPSSSDNLAHKLQDITSRVMVDALLTTPQLARRYGYPAEVHSVETSDGYVLEVHRIPFGKESPAAPDKPVAFLQHGALSSSSDWVLMGPGKGLAYILADLGYDVWMGNSRGNTYSRKHVTLDPDDKNSSFWDFSWHEMGVYDLPAVLDYVIEQTGQPDMFYVGHSQGTTEFFVLTSSLPEYNSKIRAMFSLGTAVFNTHGQNPLLDIIANFTDVDDIERLLGIGEFLPHSELLVLLGDQLCKDTSEYQFICENILFLIVGYDSEQLNKTMLPVMAAHTPAGSSTKQMIHYAQGTFSQEFRQYSHGEEANLEIYGSATPPEYDLSQVSTPVSIHYSLNDLATIENIDLLYNSLPNTIGKWEVPYPKFNHIDFVWAIDVKVLLYDFVISLMEQYKK